jgi:hypothetical protein
MQHWQVDIVRDLLELLAIICEPQGIARPRGSMQGDGTQRFRPALFEGGERIRAAEPVASVVMPTSMTLYRERSSTPSTERADISETSCSPDRPPKRTAMVIEGEAGFVSGISNW